MKIKLLLCACLISIGICGCSKTDDTASAYRKNMNEFFDNVSSINESINQIDSNSENYEEEIINKLYELDTEFSKMATYEVPAEFPYVQQLSTNAATNMSRSLTYYRMVFSDGYSEENEQLATAYYEEANKNLKYIIRILHGESYEDIKKDDPSSLEDNLLTEPVSDEDDYSMYLEEDDNDYTVYNDPDYVDDLGLDSTENEEAAN